MAWQRWITVGIVLGLLLLLFALLMPAAYQAREAARRTNYEKQSEADWLGSTQFHETEGNCRPAGSSAKTIPQCRAG